ncbi:hypothetical protein QYF36_017923 [Acer negundo]|nr:hypothetical protein QYF36_017923 [Acer negundo]
MIKVHYIQSCEQIKVCTRGGCSELQSWSNRLLPDSDSTFDMGNPRIFLATRKFYSHLEEPLFPRNVDLNVLNWWKVHTPRYPILSMMACNILRIPMSKVDSESGRRLLDHDRHMSG